MMDTKVFYGEKLYLDSKTADVNFMVIIDDEQFISIPAHRSILTVGSPVFEAMFFGPMKEKGDVKIVDATPDAFKEFLQFLYLDNVRLTSDNILTVTKLCHKYEMPDGLKLCESVLQEVLTNNVMCSGYELALILELESTITFCEQKIKRNPERILKSHDFLNCNQKTLDEILKLVSNCNASSIVESCMKWLEVKSQQNTVEATAPKIEFGSSLIHQMPWIKLSNEEFARLIARNKNLLSVTDLESIILNIMMQKDKIKENDKIAMETQVAKPKMFFRESPGMRISPVFTYKSFLKRIRPNTSDESSDSDY